MRCWWAWVGRVRLGEQCRHKWKAMDKGLIGGIATNGHCVCVRAISID